MFIQRYINNCSKLEWKCHDNNHSSWLSTYDCVVNGKSWCPECKKYQSSQRQKDPNGLKKAQDYAKSKSGFCLSTEYINTKTKLEWKCHNIQHSSWHSDFVSVVLKKRWCPHCKIDENKKIK